MVDVLPLLLDLCSIAMPNAGVSAPVSVAGLSLSFDTTKYPDEGKLAGIKRIQQSCAVSVAACVFENATALIASKPARISACFFMVVLLTSR
jgi:hypothetical protein